MAKRDHKGNPLSKGGNARPSEGRGSAPLKDFTFIEYQLTEADKDKLKALVSTGDIAEHHVFGIVATGYKFSVGPDRKGGGFLAVLSCNNQDDINYGLCLTGRGKTAEGATCSLIFRHEVLSDDGIWSTLDKRSVADDFE